MIEMYLYRDQCEDSVDHASHGQQDDGGDLHVALQMVSEASTQDTGDGRGNGGNNSKQVNPFFTGNTKYQLEEANVST